MNPAYGTPQPPRPSPGQMQMPSPALASPHYPVATPVTLPSGFRQPVGNLNPGPSPNNPSTPIPSPSPYPRPPLAPPQSAPQASSKRRKHSAAISTPVGPASATPLPAGTTNLPNRNVVYSAEAVPASKRRKKAHGASKSAGNRLTDSIEYLVPESAICRQLSDLERSMDVRLSRKKIEIFEAVQDPPRTPKTLRLYIFNTCSIPEKKLEDSGPSKTTAPGSTTNDEPPNSSTMGSKHAIPDAASEGVMSETPVVVKEEAKQSKEKQGQAGLPAEPAFVLALPAPASQQIGTTSGSASKGTASIVAPSGSNEERVPAGKTSGADQGAGNRSGEQAFWTLYVQARVLGLQETGGARSGTVAQGLGIGAATKEQEEHLTAGSLTTFVRKIEVRLDPLLYPDAPAVLWEADKATGPTSQLEVRRAGDKECDVQVHIEMNYSPERYRVSPRLASLIGLEQDTRVHIISSLWAYVKAHKLQDEADATFINCNSALKEIFGEDRVKFSAVPSRLHFHLMPAPPVVLQYRIKFPAQGERAQQLRAGEAAASRTSFFRSDPACFDVLVDAPTVLPKVMASFLSELEKHREIDELEQQIGREVEKVEEHKRKRAYLLAFSSSPAAFVTSLLAAQGKELRVMGGGAWREMERERHSDFYTQPWAEDAALRYLHRRSVSGAE